MQEKESQDAWAVLSIAPKHYPDKGLFCLIEKIVIFIEHVLYARHLPMLDIYYFF
jgi:hypothetical protein